MKRIITLLLALAMAVCAIAALTSCGGEDVGTVWYSGEAAPTAELGKAGDFYFETDTYDVWQWGEDGWAVISNLKGATGADGADGAKGDKGDTGAAGADGAKGDKGDTGSSIYLGYGGYIWCDGERTEFSVAEPEENVYEDTLAVTGDMSKFFEGDYLDLSSGTVALMAGYLPASGATVYSGLDISEISVYAEKAGKLYIGTARVADIVSARRNGTAYTVNTAEYTVTAGLNTIELPTAIEVGQNETLVIGGKGSVGLYYAKGVNIDDEVGNFAYVDGKANADVISGGERADTLAVRVKYSDIITDAPIISEMVTASNGDTVYNREVSPHLAPFAYKNCYKAFEGKTLSKIGIPVSRVGAVDENQTFTFHVVDVAGSTSSLSIVSSHTVKLPIDQLGTSTTVKKWVYVDISYLNITVATGQTLAFGKSNDTTVWGYGSSGIATDKFAFHFGTNLSWNASWTSSGASATGIYFDVWAKGEEMTFKEHIDILNAKEAEALETIEAEARAQRVALLTNALNNAGIDNFSILGDSISTYYGVTNVAGNNSTTSGNGTWYANDAARAIGVENTWWKQASALAGLDVLVNNSASGHQLTGSTANSTGFARAQQLHANTGVLNGTEPDIIAVFYGTNDLLRNVDVQTFKTAYRQLIAQMQTQYEDSQICVFTLLPSAHINATAARVTAFNAAIKEIAAEKGCVVVDIAGIDGIDAQTVTDYTIDGVHPNTDGMDEITWCFIDALYDKYIN